MIAEHLQPGEVAVFESSGWDGDTTNLVSPPARSVNVQKEGTADVHHHRL